MLRVMLVGVDRKTRQVFEQILSEQGDFEIVQVAYGREAIEALDLQNISLLVIAENLPDLDSIDLIKQIITGNPFQNIAVVSDRDPDQFHEMTEGLGVLGKITPQYSAESLNSILHRMNQSFLPSIS